LTWNVVYFVEDIVDDDFDGVGNFTVKCDDVT
jgi:hypothetical protein